MPVTVGQNHKHLGVAILLRSEVCSCPRCRRLIVAGRFPWPRGGVRLTDPTAAEWETIRLKYPQAAREQGRERESWGGRHDCASIELGV